MRAALSSHALVRSFRHEIEALLWLLSSGLASLDAQPLSLPEDCRQAVVVIAPDWNSSNGTLRRFARRDAHAHWVAAGTAVPVLIGDRGLGWGLGLHQVPEDGAPRKTEGDRRAPAGVFRLPAAFGKPTREDLPGLKLRYQPVTASLEAVDDPASRFYNRVVDRARVPQPDWRSSERMAAIPDYALGIVVAHNPDNRPGAGSCIFIHLWLGHRSGTAGCTVLHPSDLAALVEWLDPAGDPVLIQLPQVAARKGLDGILE